MPCTATYFLIATLMAAGVDGLFEQNGARSTDFRRGQSLGTRDHLVRWPKPAARPEWMTPEQYARAPDELTLREVQVAHRAPKPYPWLKIPRAQARRQIEKHGRAWETK